MLIAFAGTLVLSLILMVRDPGRLIQPGRLSEGHRNLESDCFRCHAPMQGADGQSCLSCHRLADIGRRTVAGAPRASATASRAGFHQGLAETDCMSCHTLHASARQRTTLAFKHDLLATAVRNECQACHADLKPADALHRNLMAGCASCHGVDDWRAVTFDHARWFRFDGNHPSDCRTCHAEAGNFKAYSCYGCHAHTPANIAGEHGEEGIRNFDDCARCHRSGSEGEGGRDGGGRGEGGEGEEED